MPDSGLHALNPLGGLRSLTVPRQIGDAAMPFLSELDGLRELILSGSRVTDAGPAHLHELPFLTELDLGATAITDQGLAQLAALPLRRLALRDSLVSLEGLRALREALPRCRVEPEESEGCPWRPPTVGRLV